MEVNSHVKVQKKPGEQSLMGDNAMIVTDFKVGQRDKGIIGAHAKRSLLVENHMSRSS